MRPGIYLAARNLDFLKNPILQALAPAKHQFYVMVPEHPERYKGRLMDLGNGVKGVTIGGYMKNGKLDPVISKPIEGRAVSAWSTGIGETGLQTQLSRVPLSVGQGVDSTIDKMLNMTKTFQRKAPVSYNLFSGGGGYNCNAFAQSLGQYAGLKNRVRDFPGLDVGNSSRIPKNYFKSKTPSVQQPTWSTFHKAAELIPEEYFKESEVLPDLDLDDAVAQPAVAPTVDDNGTERSQLSDSGGYVASKGSDDDDSEDKSEKEAKAGSKVKVDADQLVALLTKVTEMNLKMMNKESGEGHTGWLGADLSPELAARVSLIRRRLKRSDLLPKGTSGKPHITVAYGIDDQLDPEIYEILRKMPKGADVTIKGLSVFDNPKEKILKFDVDSPQLQAVNAEIKKRLKAGYRNDYKKYNPHITIAKLKPGSDHSKYLALAKLMEGKKFKVSQTASQSDGPLLKSAVERVVADLLDGSLIKKQAYLNGYLAPAGLDKTASMQYDQYGRPILPRGLNRATSFPKTKEAPVLNDSSHYLTKYITRPIIGDNHPVASTLADLGMYVGPLGTARMGYDTVADGANVFGKNLTPLQRGGYALSAAVNGVFTAGELLTALPTAGTSTLASPLGKMISRGIKAASGIKKGTKQVRNLSRFATAVRTGKKGGPVSKYLFGRNPYLKRTLNAKGKYKMAGNLKSRLYGATKVPAFLGPMFASQYMIGDEGNNENKE